jgi:hypothetical protein
VAGTDAAHMTCYFGQGGIVLGSRRALSLLQAAAPGDK